MKFYVTYERNGIPQMMIVDASSVEKAEHYFRHKKLMPMSTDWKKLPLKIKRREFPF